MSRRHAAGAESARGILFTILGEFVLPDGGDAWTSAFIEVMSRFGIEQKTTRQALMRTAGDGWLTPTRIGRKTSWHLTPAAEDLLMEGTDRIYGFGDPASKWNGRWLLVLVRVPETDRSARHLLRTRFTWAGLGSPTPGVWVGTHIDRIDQVKDVLHRAGVLEDAQVFLAEHSGITDLAELVKLSWDLDALDAEYRQFIDQFKERSTSDPLVRIVELVHAWRRFPWIDPDLPNEFLPKSWSGREAAKLFKLQHERLRAGAMAEWKQISDNRS